MKAYTAVDLDTLGGISTFPSSSGAFASGVHPADQIVGVSEVAGGYFHAILWSKGVATDLATLGASANGAAAEGINPSGQVVGWSGNG